MLLSKRCLPVNSNRGRVVTQNENGCGNNCGGNCQSCQDQVPRTRNGVRNLDAK